MPARDRTGPMGMGPMTGRAMGYCAGYGAPNRETRGAWSGLGRGGGRGWRNWFHATGLPRWARWGLPPAAAYGAPFATPSPEQEIDLLKDQAEWLKDQLDRVNQRMGELSQE